MNESIHSNGEDLESYSQSAVERIELVIGFRLVADILMGFVILDINGATCISS